MNTTAEKGDSVVIPLRLSRSLVKKLDEALRLTRLGSRNQLIREALEEYVGRTVAAKVLEVKEVSVGQAARLIDGYLTKNPGAHYVSELSEKLGIELGTAFKAVERLKANGAVRPRE